MKDYPIHPAAASARLMREDELAALAADIAENGQRDPITIGKLNGSQALVDGRNRKLACERAGVEPKYETKEFESEEEIKRFVRSRNKRRDMTLSEHAMQEAMLWPEPERGGRGKKGKASEFSDGFGVSIQHAKNLISDARAVYRYSRELAEAVREGSLTLDEAKERVKADQDVLGSADTKHARLCAEAPDLADQVHKERLTLGEAWAAFEERKKEQARIEENRRETLIRVVESAYRNIFSLAAEEFIDDLRMRLTDPKFREAFTTRVRFDPSMFGEIEVGAQNLLTIANELTGGKDDTI